MSETTEKVYDKGFTANKQQNSPNLTDLEVQLKKDSDAHEAAKLAQEPTTSEQETDTEDSESSNVDAVSEDKPEIKDDKEETKKQLARLNHDRRQAERQARQLAEENARLRGEGPAFTPDELTERAVQERATALAAQKAFDSEALKVLEAGRKQYTDFDASIKNFEEINGITNQMIEASMDAGNAHDIIHYLANNLDEAERIKTLPLHKMGAAIGKISAKVAAPPPKPQSKAPPPIKPLAGTSRSEPTLEKMSMAEFIANQDKADRERRQKGKWS